MFTPGIDGGGTYTVVVQAAGQPITHAYRLAVAPAQADDTAPGVTLGNGPVVPGTLAGRSLDTVDLYRFTVARPGELTTVRLHQRAAVGFDLRILDELGRQVSAVRGSTGSKLLRLHLTPAAYYAALEAPPGMAGRYSLQVQIRDITTTSLSVAGGTSFVTGPGVSVPLTVSVTSASHGGTVNVQIDHFDPLFGWHFDSALTGQVDSSGSFTTGWTPPSVGIFRAHARFVGNAYSSFSDSDSVRVQVAEPLE